MSSKYFGPDHFPQFLPEQDGFMKVLEEDALSRGMRICGPSIAQMLSVMVRATGAKRVLELGVSVGYSTIHMARALPEDGRIIAMEWDAEVAAEAKANFEKAGVADRIDLRVGDARLMMKEIEPASFDFIFMDFEKEMYSEALPDCARLLREGGTLFCDNVAFRSSGNFNQELADLPGFDTSFIFGNYYKHSPDEDAVSISVRTGL
jgi:predicted O-methyltransferase YrrM